MRQAITDIFIGIYSLIASLFSADYSGRLYKILNKENCSASATMSVSDTIPQSFQKRFRSGMKWGNYHPSSPHQWWGGVDVSPTLVSKFVPKRFKDVLVPYRADVLQSVQSFGYGAYFASIDLAPSEWDWMSFWLYSTDGIGEIDIFEFYTDPLEGSEKFETTVHYGDYSEDGHKRTTAKSGYVSRTARKPAEFICIWKENYIKIYFNGVLVRKIVDRGALNELKGKRMSVIIQCGVMPEKAQMHSKTESYMNVRKFSYFPLHK